LSVLTVPLSFLLVTLSQVSLSMPPWLWLLYPKSKALSSLSLYLLSHASCYLSFPLGACVRGRLQSPQETSGQRIVHPDPILSGVGVRFVPVNHEGNSTVCEEECDRIVLLYDWLLREGCFQNHRGTLSPLSRENIMVVAPFTLQVDRLKKVLGREARVGTIDLFQG